MQLNPLLNVISLPKTQKLVHLLAIIIQIDCILDDYSGREFVVRLERTPTLDEHRRERH